MRDNAEIFRFLVSCNKIFDVLMWWEVLVWCLVITMVDFSPSHQPYTLSNHGLWVFRVF